MRPDCYKEEEGTKNVDARVPDPNRGIARTWVKLKTVVDETKGRDLAVAAVERGEWSRMVAMAWVKGVVPSSYGKCPLSIS